MDLKEQNLINLQGILQEWFLNLALVGIGLLMVCEARAPKPLRKKKEVSKIPVPVHSNDRQSSMDKKGKKTQAKKASRD